MGKGDKKTKRGKLIMGSYGVRRPKRSNKTMEIAAVKEPEVAEVIAETAPPAPKKPAVKKEAKPKAEKKAAAKPSKKAKEA